MNPGAQAQDILDHAPLDHRLALGFTPAADRARLAVSFAVYLEIREVLVECRDPGVAEVKLRWWEQEIEALYAGKARHPFTQALAPSLAALQGRQHLFLDLITGTRMDIAAAGFASFEDVKRYCYRHSGALAELQALMLGAKSKDALLAARLLGNSVRLAAIATAGSAEALRGKVYFAAEDLQKHGVDKHISGETHAEAPVRALVQDYAGRAWAMHAESLATLPPDERAALLPWHVMGGLAMARVRRLERSGFSVEAEPVELSPLNSLFTAWRAARQAR